MAVSSVERIMDVAVEVAKQLANGNAGFITDFQENYSTATDEDLNEIMGYYPLDFLPGLHALARDFLICDHWFSSVPGPTWTNRFFALSGTSMGRVLMPQKSWSESHLDEFFHQHQATIFDRLNEAKKTWKVYHYDFCLSWLLLHQLSPANLARYAEINDFFKEVRDPAHFPDFVFIEPKYNGQDQNDDHPPHNVIKADKLIADVYNAIRSVPGLWESTLLVILFDEHGGFYDHVVPPAAPPPDEHQEEYTFDRFGVRVPALLVSPHVEKGVRNQQFDHTSLLKYLINKWDLGPLGNRTANARSIEDLITPTSRNDTIPFIRVPYTDLIPPRPELEKEHLTDHQAAMDAFGRYLEIQTKDPAFAAMLERPGKWAQLKAALGKKAIALGNWLTKDVEAHTATKAERTKQLISTLKSGRYNLRLE
jgi:phospholipase C